MSEACEENLAWIAAGQVKDKTRRRAKVEASGHLQGSLAAFRSLAGELRQAFLRTSHQYGHVSW